MLTAPRRGFTLVEITISTVMLLIVSGSVYHLLFTTQRLTRAQTEQANVQASVRNAALVIVNELRDLSSVDTGGPAENDPLRLEPDAVTYRAMRGFGLLCQPATATQIRYSRNGFSAHRDPQAGRDSVLVFLDGNALSAADDVWLALAVSNVSVGTGCPAGAPSVTLTVPRTEALAGIAAGNPVRIYEIMELRLYRSEGKSWLGMRSVSSGESIQPLTGPMRDVDGTRLEYLDAAGGPVSVPSQVKSVRLTVRGIAEISGSGGAAAFGYAEQLSTQIALRNALP